MEIEINGSKYRLIEQPVHNHGTGMKSAYLYALAGMMGGISSMYGGSKPKQARLLPIHDLIREYERIQRKESKLSAQDRQSVVHQFNKHFKKVE